MVKSLENEQYLQVYRSLKCKIYNMYVTISNYM